MNQTQPTAHIVKYKLWVIENYGKLSNDDERRLAYDRYCARNRKDELRSN